MRLAARASGGPSVAGIHCGQGAQGPELRLDRVGPRRVRRREAQLHVFSLGPAPDCRGLAGRQVVQDDEQPSFSGRVLAAATITATSSSLIRRGRPPAHRGSSAARPLALNRWITSRTGSSSAATSRAIAGTSVPDADADADAMMIIARRTRTDPCFPRRTICSSRRPSSSVSRRARIGSAITPPATRPHHKIECPITHRAASVDPVNVRGQRNSLPSAHLVSAFSDSTIVSNSGVV